MARRIPGKPAGGPLRSGTRLDSLPHGSGAPLPPHRLSPCKLDDTFNTSKCINPGALLAEPVGLLAAESHSRLLALSRYSHNKLIRGKPQALREQVSECLGSA